MKKITKNTLAVGVFLIVMGVVFFISRSTIELSDIISRSTGVGNPLQKGSPPGKDDALPTLVVAHGNEVTILHYESPTKKYQKHKHYSHMEPVASLAILGNKVFIQGSHSMSRLSADMENELRVNLTGPVGVVEASDTRLYTSSHYKFYELNGDLWVPRELAVLNLGWLTKNPIAHNVLIHAGIAYVLLDSSVSLNSKSVYRFDLKNPKGMVPIDDELLITGGGINSLSTQWLNVELDQWIVVELDVFEGKEATQKIHIFPLKKGEERVEHQVYSSREEGNERPFIHAVTKFAPVWAIVGKKDDSYLTEIHTENDEISFSTLYTLDVPVHDDNFLIKRFEDHLFITVQDNLIIIDITAEPKQIIFQEIEGDFITDFEFFLESDDEPIELFAEPATDWPHVKRNEWLKYRNGDFGIEFEYPPPDWIVDEYVYHEPVKKLDLRIQTNNFRILYDYAQATRPDADSYTPFKNFDFERTPRDFIQIFFTDAMSRKVYVDCGVYFSQNLENLCEEMIDSFTLYDMGISI